MTHKDVDHMTMISMSNELYTELNRTDTNYLNRAGVQKCANITRNLLKSLPHTLTTLPISTFSQQQHAYYQTLLLE